MVIRSLSITSITQHQGEKDTKGPGDFSGAGGGKFDDNGDGDDDAVDEDDDEVPVRSKKRRSGARLSMQDADGDVSLSTFLLYFSSFVSRSSRAIFVVISFCSLDFCHRFFQISPFFLSACSLYFSFFTCLLTFLLERLPPAFDSSRQWKHRAHPPSAPYALKQT